MIGPRDNTRNLRLNKPGLFTPTVVRGMRQGPSNNSVNFGRSSNTLADSSINSTSSFKYTVDGTGLRNTQQLNIDWSNFENHTFFNSAQVKTNVAFERIFNEFPFDGTREEFELFFANLTGFEKWVYDNFPKNIGYLFFSGSSLTGSMDDGTYVTVKDIAGAAFPTVSTNRSGQSPINPDDSSVTLEMWVYLPTQENSASAIIDKHANPNSSLSQQGFYVSLSGSSSTTTGSISFHVLSGTITDQVTLEVEKGKWNHVAWVWDRSPSVNKVIGYVNENFFASSSQPIEFGTIVAQSADLLIGSGSAITSSFGPTIMFTPETTFSGAIDELRIWHSVRTQNQLKQYREKAVFASEDLVLYYKFNEPSGSNSPIVLDHSSNSLHGRLNTNALVLGIREIPTSSIAGKSPMIFEKTADSPVLFPDYEDLSSFRTELLTSASLYDNDNPNLITKLVPVHYFLEGQVEDGLETETGAIIDALQSGDDPRSVRLGATQTLLLLLYTWAKFFDEMKLYIQTLSTLNTVDYDQTDTVPDQFLLYLARNEGVELPPLFEGSSIEQFVEAENIQSDISTNDLSLLAIRNQIWRRILINLQDVVRSKGTIHSIKAFIRSVGIDPDNNFRIREYGGPTKLPLTFAREKRSEISTTLNFASGGLLTSPFLSASRIEPGFPNRAGTTNDSLLTSGSWTFEATYKFPDNMSANTTQSLARMHVTRSGVGGHANPGVLSNLVTVKGGYTTLYVRANSVTSHPLFTLSITGADLFDGNNWYVSFGRERNDQFGSTISSSYFLRIAKQNFGDFLESYTTSSFHNDSEPFNPATNLWQNYNANLNSSGSFIAIGSQSIGNNAIDSLINAVSSPEAAKTYSFAGKVTQIRFWSKALTDDEWREHVLNFRSVGIQEPLTNFNFNTTTSGSWERLRIDASTDQPTTESNSSGTIFLTDFTQNNFTMTGSSFPATSSVIVPERFHYSYLSPKFDQAATTEKVRVRSFQNFDLVQETPWAQVAPVYETPRSEMPTDNNRFTIDYSVVDALDQDIITIFASLDEFNNALGAPELLFSPDYPNLESLRDVYFNKLINKMNLKLFFEFYKWFDTNIGTFVEQLIPRKTKFLGTNFVVESHMLERSKVEYLYSDIYLGDNLRHALKDTILLQLITGTFQKY